MDWQMIRPSFLVFLNYVMPKASTPWKEPTTLQIAEIGVAAGLNSKLMLKAYKHTFLHLVDSYKTGQSANKMLEYLKSFSERIKFTEKPSIEAAKDYPDNFFDYVYIDGAHDYKNILQDMKAWYPKVKIGGILAGHDWWFTDIRKAVNDFLQDCPQRLYGVQSYFQESAPTYLTSEEAQGIDWWFVKRTHEGGE